VSTATATARTTPTLAAAETALGALGVVTALGFCRLFDDNSFAASLLLAVVGSSLLAIACRRGGLGLVTSAALSVVALVELATITFYRPLATAGFLPNTVVWDTLTRDVSNSWGNFATAIAPVPADRGYLLVAIAALWVGAWLSDGFAFRAGVNVESLVPYGIVFVFTSALAADRYRVAVTALWVVAAVVTYALLRGLREEAAGWLSAHRRGAATSAVRVGGGLAVVAVVGAMLVGPALPGAGEDPLVDTRHGGTGSRQVFSPLVDIKGRLTDQSESVAFVVNASEAQYWRLTALDDFDGRQWTSTRGYGDADGRLGGGLPTDVTAPVEQQVTIGSLDSVWLPVAYSPSSIDIGKAVRYDDDTASLVTRQGVLREGTTYNVVSRVPRLTPDELRAANDAAPARIRQQYLGLPNDFSPAVVNLAREVVGDAATTYDKAIALQSYFRDNFTYDLTVPKGSGSSAIETFLEGRRGYCEQFSGTFAAMARTLGIPARVAVGFTPGVRDGNVFRVQGKHAHAWPEVWFTGVGWVPFEPTPTRGAPGNDSYTGVPAQQVGEPPATSDQSTSASTSPANSGTVAQVEDDVPNIPAPAFDAQPSAKDSGGATFWLLRLVVVLAVALVVGLVWLVTVPRLVKRRWAVRRARAGSNAERVLVDWHEACFLLARAGSPPLASETPREYAARAAANRRVNAGGMVRLAERATIAAYAAGDLPDSAVADSGELCRTLAAELWDRADTRTRLRWTLDPRPLLQPLPSARFDETRELTTVG
jgi:transglutaminase-like putative cysteine protease